MTDSHSTPRPTAPALLHARDLHHSYGPSPALRGASVEVAAGEILAITGPSGSGKSTLLHCLAGIVSPSDGEVVYAGRRLDRLSTDERTRLRRVQMGLVLQFGQLVPDLTAVENVALPLLLEKVSRRTARATAVEWLDRLGVGELAGARPGAMSGGQAQRVAIARALVTGPQVVFADEPTGALDTVTGERALEVLVSTTQQSGAALVVVTHDNRVAAAADREVVLRDGATEPALAGRDGA